MRPYIELDTSPNTNNNEEANNQVKANIEFIPKLVENLRDLLKKMNIEEDRFTESFNNISPEIKRSLEILSNLKIGIISELVVNLISIGQEEDLDSLVELIEGNLDKMSDEEQKKYLDVYDPKRIETLLSGDNYSKLKNGVLYEEVALNLIRDGQELLLINSINVFSRLSDGSLQIVVKNLLERCKDDKFENLREMILDKLNDAGYEDFIDYHPDLFQDRLGVKNEGVEKIEEDADNIEENNIEENEIDNKGNTNLDNTDNDVGSGVEKSEKNSDRKFDSSDIESFNKMKGGEQREYLKSLNRNEIFDFFEGNKKIKVKAYVLNNEMAEHLIVINSADFVFDRINDFPKLTDNSLTNLVESYLSNFKDDELSTEKNRLVVILKNSKYSSIISSHKELFETKELEKDEPGKDSISISDLLGVENNTDDQELEEKRNEAYKLIESGKARELFEDQSKFNDKLFDAKMANKLIENNGNTLIIWFIDRFNSNGLLNDSIMERMVDNLLKLKYNYYNNWTNISNSLKDAGYKDFVDKYNDKYSQISADENKEKDRDEIKNGDSENEVKDNNADKIDEAKPISVDLSEALDYRAHLENVKIKKGVKEKGGKIQGEQYRKSEEVAKDCAIELTILSERLLLNKIDETFEETIKNIASKLGFREETVKEIYQNEEEAIKSQAMAELSKENSTKNILIAVGKVLTYGAGTTLGCMFFGGLLLPGAIAGLRIIDRMATDFFNKKQLEKKVDEIKKTKKAKNEDSVIQARLASSLSLKKKMEIDSVKLGKDKQGTEGILKEYLNEEIAGERIKVEGDKDAYKEKMVKILSGLNEVDNFNNEKEQKLIKQHEISWFEKLGNWTSGKSTGEKFISAGVPTAILISLGYIAKEIPVIRTALAAYAGWRLGGVFGDLVSGSKKGIIDSREIKDKKDYVEMRELSLNADFKKKNPEKWLKIKDELNKYENEAVAKIEGKEVVNVLNDDFKKQLKRTNVSEKVNKLEKIVWRTGGAALGAVIGDYIETGGKNVEKMGKIVANIFGGHYKIGDDIDIPSTTSSGGSSTKDVLKTITEKPSGPKTPEPLSDTISNLGLKPGQHDSVWRSTEQIFKDHAKDLGYNAKTDGNLDHWAQLQTAKAINNPSSDHFDKVFERNSVVVEKGTDGTYNVQIEQGDSAAPGHLPQIKDKPEIERDIKINKTPIDLNNLREFNQGKFTSGENISEYLHKGSDIGHGVDTGSEHLQPAPGTNTQEIINPKTDIKPEEIKSNIKSVNLEDVKSEGIANEIKLEGLAKLSNGTHVLNNGATMTVDNGVFELHGGKSSEPVLFIVNSSNNGQDIVNIVVREGNGNLKPLSYLEQFDQIIEAKKRLLASFDEGTEAYNSLKKEIKNNIFEKAVFKK